MRSLALLLASLFLLQVVLLAPSASGPVDLFELLDGASGLVELDPSVEYVFDTWGYNYVDFTGDVVVEGHGATVVVREPHLLGRPHED